jgi:butyryl-CoA dehydrogenase
MDRRLRPDRSHGGSDSFNVRTRAELDGDHYLLNGEKLWITNGGIADVVSVFARTERGVTASRSRPPGGFSAGPKEKKMGIRGSMTNPSRSRTYACPRKIMIGQDGRGFITAMKTLDAGRLGLGACCVGAARK